MAEAQIELVHEETLREEEKKNKLSITFQFKLKETKNMFEPMIMKILRERKGLEEDDESEDKEICEYTPEEALQELCAWEFGDRGWASWFIDRAERCGMQIEQECHEL